MANPLCKATTRIHEGEYMWRVTCDYEKDHNGLHTGYVDCAITLRYRIVWWHDFPKKVNKLALAPSIRITEGISS